ncbi:2095_t:CDS:2, partial [Paraglomus brasilianum]
AIPTPNAREQAGDSLAIFTKKPRPLGPLSLKLTGGLNRFIRLRAAGTPIRGVTALFAQRTPLRTLTELKEVLFSGPGSINQSISEAEARSEGCWVPRE